MKAGSEYLEIGSQLLNNIRNKDAISDIFQMNTISVDEKLETFSILDQSTLAYSNFYENYLLQNRPCLFARSLTTSWCASRKWCCKIPALNSTIDGEVAIGDVHHNTINYDFLSEIYGTCEVSVTNCDDILENYDNPSCESMTLKQYIEYLKTYSQNGHPPTMPCLYLKDWHLVLNATENEKPYIVPSFFASDWLNETANEIGDDFRFVYIGPKGSWTPFHSDVYGSYSWSANIIGTKKWYLYPAGKEERFRTTSNKILFDYENPGRRDLDFYEVIQNAGEVIFIPSGWHHVVWNLENTISINHNWINAANVGYIWVNLKNALVAVKRELQDLKESEDFPEICQGLLKANHGMNYSSFVQILSIVLTNRRTEVNYLPNYQFGPIHIEYDTLVLNKLFIAMKADSEVNELINGRQSDAFREVWGKFETQIGL